MQTLKLILLFDFKVVEKVSLMMIEKRTYKFSLPCQTVSWPPPHSLACETSTSYAWNDIIMSFHPSCIQKLQSYSYYEIFYDTNTMEEKYPSDKAQK